MNPFLKNIAQELLNLPQEVLRQTVVVLPSRRSILFLKNHISKSIDQPIFSPTFYSIQDYITELSGLGLVDNLTLQFKLYEVYKSSVLDGPVEDFDAFLKWSQTLLNDFNELDRYLVDPQQLFCNLTDLKEIDQWTLNDSDLTPFQKKYILFFEKMYTWYVTLQKQLLIDNLAYQGLIYRKVAEEIHLKKFPVHQIWFVGLNALTKSEYEIISYLKKIGKAKLFWDSDIYYMNNLDHEAGFFLRQYQDEWGGMESSDFFSLSKNINFIGCPKNIAQVRAASEIISHCDRKDLRSGKVALVLPDEQMLFPVLNNLPADLEFINITMGSPLNSTPLYNLLDLIIGMQARMQKNKNKGFYFKDVQKLLRNQYINYLVDKSILNKIETEICQKNIIFINIASFELCNDNILLKLLSPWNTSDCLIALQALISDLKEELISSSTKLESEVLFSFQKIIIQLSNYLDLTEELFSLKTLHVIFRKVIGKEKIQFSGEPLKGLQLMGLLETRALDFKQVIVLNVNEGKLPLGKSHNSFIPFILRKYFKMSTHEQRDAVSAYHFYRLLQRSNDINLIYNTQNDDFGSGEKSRFITQIKSEVKKFNINSTILSPEFIQDEKQFIIDKTTSVQKSIIEWAENKVSPSSLNNYLSCPLQFYHQYIASIYTDKKIEEFIESSTLGSVVHEALEYSYKPFLNKKLVLNDLNKIESDLLRKVTEYFQDQFGDALEYGKNHLLHKVALEMCSRFLNQEKKILQQGDELIVLALEEELTHTIKIENISVKLYGKVDRIDSLNGQIRIIDYKTGFVEQKDLIIPDWNLDNHFKKNKAFQLMMYAYLYIKSHKTNDFVWAGNYSFKNIAEGVCYIRNKNVSYPCLISNEDVQDFEQYLQLLISDIKDAAKPFSQTNQLCECEYCKFFK